MNKDIVFLSLPEEVSMADEWFEIASVDHFWMEWRFRVIRRNKILRDLLKPNDRFLEIGCGHGQFLLQSDARLPVIADGCDLNLRALNKISRVKGDVFVYDILELNPKMIAKYQGIFLLDVIEHISNDDEFLTAGLRHVTDHGLVIINVPALNILFSQYDTVAGHQRRYSKKSLLALIERCGIEPLHVQYWGFSLLPIALLRKLYLKFVPSKKVIKKGFDPGSPFINGIFKILMRIELFLIPNPILGTSVLAVGRKRATQP